MTTVGEIIPTTSWGTRLANLSLINLPRNMVAQVFLTDKEEELLFVVYRWDRHQYLGWENSFSVIIKFPDGAKKYAVIPSSSKLTDGHSVIIKLSEGVNLARPLPARTIPRRLINISRSLDMQESHEVRMIIRNGRTIASMLHCGATYILLDDAAMQQEAALSEIPNLVNALSALKSGSFKADIMRYYLLYKYGGVYHDDKAILRYSMDSPVFDDILGNSDFAIGVMNSGDPEIAFMASRPGCEIMRRALETSIDNVMQRYYGPSQFSVTGNKMLRKVMEEAPGSYYVGGDLKSATTAFELHNIDRRNSEKSTSVIARERAIIMGERVSLMRIERCDDKILLGDREDVVWMRCAVPYYEWPKPASYYTTLWHMRQLYVDNNDGSIVLSRQFFMRSVSTRTKMIVVVVLMLLVVIIMQGSVAL